MRPSLLLLFAALLGAARAQDPALPTLRVFSDLVQVPTLVLDNDGKPVSEKAAGKFFVSIDGGRRFPATHVRLEGEDPISLAVLLDASGSQEQLLKEAAAALRSLVPGSSALGGLRARDHVSVYAIDCRTIRSLEDKPATEAQLDLAAERVLAAPTLHDGRPAGACAARLHLWDTLTVLADRLAALPGRRVLLAVTNGNDGGSTEPWKDLARHLETLGVTLFGINQIDGLFPLQRTAEDHLNIVCQSSGGWLFRTDAPNLPAALERVITLVRSRFIVQFPRGKNFTSGMHNLEVTTSRGSFLVRAAGLSFPLLDPAVLADPNVLQSDPANAPEQGTRRLIFPK